MVDVFKKILIDNNVLMTISRLKSRVIEKKFFNNKDFLIILRKNSILSLYLTWTIVIIIVTIDVTALSINCLKKESISRLNSK